MKDNLKTYLGDCSDRVLQEFGKPKDCYSDSNEVVCFFYKATYLLCRDEIVFFIKGNKVKDIVVTEYVLGMPRWNIFYYEDQASLVKFRCKIRQTAGGSKRFPNHY